MTETGVPVPSDPRAELAVRRLAAYGSVAQTPETTPVVSHEVGEDGSWSTFVDWPEPGLFDGDEQLARLVCLAGLPLDRRIDDLEPARHNREVEGVLIASAAHAERRRRRDVVEKRRREADVHFVKIEAEALARKRKRGQR